jgi:hypothetical protein
VPQFPSSDSGKLRNYDGLTAWPERILSGHNQSDLLKCLPNGLPSKRNPATFSASDESRKKCFARASMHGCQHMTRRLYQWRRALREYAARRREIDVVLGVASGSIGPVRDGSADNTPGTGASSSRFRIALHALEIQP